MKPRLIALLIALLPLLVLLGPGKLMEQLSGRAHYERTADPVSLPLNLRLQGYELADVSAYWQWLGAAGQAAERRFLLMDLGFPVLYGAVLIACLLLAWRLLGQAPRGLWLLAPGLTVLADWLENSIHLQQLAHHAAGLALNASLIAIASAATRIKLVLYAWSCVLIWRLVWRGSHRRAAQA
ncbi:hypothetical protein SAMN04488038_111144 [Solimonas aquatica]|uniref:Uncharacterized protein n=1 Tax=Solimonas aquatica TaxID=489703 RepID=A0A1H9JFH4_9GAMM|nr:hypothetical protein [Solimonas aquatica]SEQ85602.1 hypothetical protein SAMN04488038_111144 [Solimonas aquatica]